jgi:hypothetical protein
MKIPHPCHGDNLLTEQLSTEDDEKAAWCQMATAPGHILGSNLILRKCL